MKPLSLRGWPQDLSQLEGVLYFAQLWEEMLFDYTIDSYKMRTFNLPALCIEFMSAHSQCESQVLHWKSLPALRDEIRWHLENDPIARKVLGASLHEIESKVESWKPESATRDLTHACSFIVRELGNAYFAAIKSELLSLLSSPREKKKIQRTASSLLVEMVRRGFAAPYIYHRLAVFFFGSRAITAVSDVSDFLARFDEEQKVFTVICHAPYRGSLLSQGIQRDFMMFDTHVHSNLPAGEVVAHGTINRFTNNGRSGNGFLVFKKVKAMDPYSARKAALERLDKITSVVRFVRHQLDEDECTNAEWLVSETVVNGDEWKDANIIPAPRNISFRRPDVKEERLQESLVSILRPFIGDLCDEETKERLTAALNAHAAGVRSNLADNRFMNFWRAFETLAGSTTEGDTIQTIIRCSIPVLSRKYFLKQMHALFKALKRCQHKGWKAASTLRQEGETNPAFLARLLVDGECAAAKDALFDVCARNPLLRNRLALIQDVLLHHRLASDALAEHENRLRWHIQRMYRVRNSIVHGSRRYAWLDLLSENLHDYFDHMFSEIVKQISDQDHHTTIEMALFEIDIKYTAYKAKLKAITNQTPKIEAANIVLFGAN